MTKPYVSKKDAAAKVSQNIKKYLEKVKPKYSTLFTPAIWKKLSGILFGMISGQSCFLNTISESTPHYLKKKKEGRLLQKRGQVEKLSGYLLSPYIFRILFSFLFHIRQGLFRKGYCSDKERRKRRKMNIEERVYHKRLMLHDGTDIQKPYAKKMEDLCCCRDGSQSSAKKAKTGKGYLIEGSVAYWKGRLFPCLLSLFSTTEKSHLTEKEETKKNLQTLRKSDLVDGLLHIFDRGYDAISFMAWCIKENINFLIRANLNRTVIRQEEYNRRIKKKTTQKKIMEMFYPLTSLIKRMSFQSCREAKYSWFSVAWEKLYFKGENFPKDPQDLTPVTFLSVRITDKETKGIDEDLYPEGKTNGQEEKEEREIHFFTTENIENADDAAVLFLCYLLRWKIETFFRWIKQIFGLESVRLQSFKKIQNLLFLLCIASHYLYGRFRDFQSQEEQSKTLLLTTIFQKDKSKRDDETIVSEILFFHFLEYCQTKGLTINPDSFAKALHELMKHDEAYQKISLGYDYLDSG
jgi:hypothetical protein